MSMNYYMIDWLGDVDDPHGLDYCFVHDPPSLGDARWMRLRTGRKLADTYPTRPEDATLSISRRRRGLMLPDFIANTLKLYIVRRPVAEAITHLCSDPRVEVHGFRLLDTKGRVHSDDYVFINPTLPLAGVTRPQATDDAPLEIDEVALDRSRGTPPDLFRVDDDPSSIIHSERLVDLIMERGFKNFKFSMLGPAR